MNRRTDGVVFLLASIQLTASIGCLLPAEDGADSTEAVQERALRSMTETVLEIYKPNANRELRVWEKDGVRIEYVVVDGVVVKEGDIILGPVESYESSLTRGVIGTDGVGLNNDLWSMPIYYSFKNSVTAEMRVAVDLALKRLVEQGQADILFMPCQSIICNYISNIVFDRSGKGAPLGSAGSVIRSIR